MKNCAWRQRYNCTTKKKVLKPCDLRTFQFVKKVLADFFARLKNAMFFVKLYFTKNLAVLVKKSDKSDVFDGYLSNSRIARRRCRWQMKALRNFRSRTVCVPPQC
ncbi:MAG: hypothetical protein PUJ93_07805, partial [Oscillospiraceae bacterium]|nr:hypothetical protein [Oscillospiraceae bacterium]MDY5735878.1 hypothetical protein [Oscillospiraceae bacterium]